LKSEVKNLAKDYQDLLKELLKIQKSLEDKADKKTMERVRKFIQTGHDRL